MKVNHSPTPWSRNRYGELRDANGEHVRLTGVALACGIVGKDDPAHGNQRLFDAAPDLLEQVRQLRMLLSNLIFDAKANRPWSPQAADNLRLAADDTDAVIAKATGES